MTQHGTAHLDDNTIIMCQCRPRKSHDAATPVDVMYKEK